MLKHEYDIAAIGGGLGGSLPPKRLRNVVVGDVGVRRAQGLLGQFAIKAHIEQNRQILKGASQKC